MKKSEEIGKRIKKSRESKKMTQTELGAALSTPVTPTAISLYEDGKRDLTIEALSEIADKLDVSLGYLIKGQEEDVSIRVALRTDPKLKDNPQARDQINDFIEFMKNKTK